MTQWLISLVGTWGLPAIFVTMTGESGPAAAAGNEGLRPPRGSRTPRAGTAGPSATIATSEKTDAGIEFLNRGNEIAFTM